MTRNGLNKTRLLLTAGALFVSCGAALPAAAQSSYEATQLMNRIHQLENQIQTLSQAVYKGDMSGAASMASGGAAAAAAANETRLSGIEDQQRNLTGQLEKINFDLQQIKGRLDKMQADTEQRFQQLERSASSSSSVVAPAPAPQPEAAPAPAAATAPAGTLGTLGGGTAPAATGGAAEVMYEEAFAAIRNAKYDDAEARFRQFMSQYPGHPLTANAQYWLGETYYVRGDYKQAARTFAQGYQDYPKSAKAEDSLYKLAMSLAKMGKKDDACLSLRQMEQVFTASTAPVHQKGQEQIKQLGCP